MVTLRAARMQPEDSTYWFVREAFGWSVVLQLVWRFPRPPEPAALRAFAAGLADGVLSRRIVVPRTPLARPRWQHEPHPAVLLTDPGAIPAGSVEAWAGAELDGAPLDPERRPSWRLRGTALDDGGYALSLTTLHLVADGRTMVTAALDALAGTAADPLHRRPEPRALADTVDGIGVLGAAGRGIARAAAAATRTRSTAPEITRDRGPAHERAPLARPAWTTVTVAAEAWEKAARAHGGTPNTLFVAVLAGVLRAAGYTGTLKLGIPVSTRADGDDERGNATAGVSVPLAGDPAPGDDLTALRRACKAAFTRLAAGNRTPLVHLTPLLGLLPTKAVVKAVSSGSGMPDAVASNLGDFPAELARVGDVTASAVAFRGTAQGVDPALPYRFGDGVQSWLLRIGGSITFSVAAFDEQHFPGDTLRTLLGAELDRWGVPRVLW
ncbi:hypothetical protein [Nocardia harenae]|uniref:hypothetical protein n=1 Tax=Nocardia harenae TaxID=358707 RepID=UPI000834CD69|nr:hypothetical protein [Nocardia harenae]